MFRLIPSAQAAPADVEDGISEGNKRGGRAWPGSERGRKEVAVVTWWGK
jgi:hypothetical protein